MLGLIFLSHPSIHLSDCFPVALGALDAVPIHKFIDDVSDLDVMTEKLVQFVVESCLKEFLAC